MRGTFMLKGNQLVEVVLFLVISELLRKSSVSRVFMSLDGRSATL